MHADPVVAFAKVQECLCGLIEQEGMEVCSCSLVVGDLPAYDYCGGCADACGSAFVSISTGAVGQGLTSTVNFTSCADGYYLSGSAGILRCVPMGYQGEPADDEDMDALAARVLQDMQLVRKALVCCYDGDLSLGAWTAIPPNGGCAGGYWDFTLPFGM